VRLGRPPAGERERRAWLQEVRVIAADRDRYQITDPNPLGGEPSPQARLDHDRAQAAILRARQIASDSRAQRQPSRTPSTRTSPSL
jgi:hypothetical protein